MRTTWVAADHVISPLGFSSDENYQAIRKMRTGIRLMENSRFSKTPVHLAAIIDSPDVGEKMKSNAFTRFEQLIVQSVEGALQKVKIDTTSPRVLFILSTTKGNIDLLEQGKGESRSLDLPETARRVSQFFQNPNTPIVISNACVSGVTAMLMGKRILEAGQFDHAVVIGADVLSRFVVSGFQSLSALSQEPCKPFDKNRKGTTLGEAIATVVLTHDASVLGRGPRIKILGGGLSNDANHISGPSRTGAELANAIDLALRSSGVNKESIDFISAHGTATLFNDEMEAKAFGIAGLENVPLNSLKGYFGHTLGAAGVIESVMSIQALLNDELIPTVGFEELGVSLPLKVTTQLESSPLTICLKTASGFGGCNAAMVLCKE